MLPAQPFPGNLKQLFGEIEKRMAPETGSKGILMRIEISLHPPMTWPSPREFALKSVHKALFIAIMDR